MLFNSLDFAFFLPLVFILYWFVVKEPLKLQNVLVLLSSYVFYGWWDPRFLLLIAFSTTVDYFIGLSLANSEKPQRRKLLLWTSILINIGMLGYFKYANFFIDNFISAFSAFGLQLHETSLQIILPVGISFYTFQTLSYTIDVYRKKLEPSRDFIAFAAFVSFFPQLVAGPIERATHLLPQFYKKRVFQYENAVNGLRQILWGFFKKLVIADNCAKYANIIFDNSHDYNGSTLAMGAFLFAFQIYGDFSGYSDIAIGSARLFGFDLKQNFAHPYFSRDIAEFWRRWHISLSTWFRDYVYIPLGGSRTTRFKTIRNVFIIFLVSGFWHGANWTFIAWGAVHALFFLPLLLFQKNRKNLTVVAKDRFWPSSKDLLAMGITFTLTTLAWVFFRAENISEAIEIFGRIFSKSILETPQVLPLKVCMYIAFFMTIEWLGRRRKFAIEDLSFLSKPLRWICYLGLILMIYLLGRFSQEIEFIYFQF
jgi:D-alanyl-lipoteichoic acid acyltransferase DltB (MBOAT superfamily)